HSPFSRLYLSLVEIGAHVLKRRKTPPPIDQWLQFQLRLDPALFAAGVGQDAPMRVVNKTASGMIMFRVLSATVDADDVGQILNRSRFEQRRPVVIAYGRPTGDDGDQVCATRGRPAEELGESQVIANERRDREFLT